MTPEAKARVTIDALLTATGWHVCSVADANLHAAVGVAIREFPLNAGFGYADYLLYVNGKACGVIEAKKEGATLTGVERQSSRYAKGLPTTLPAWSRPLPFVWESTGLETHFTNGLDPEPRARNVFTFFRPELLVRWLALLPPASQSNSVSEPPSTFLARMRNMPKLVTEWGSGGAHYQLAVPPLNEQGRIVAEVDRHISIIREVEAEVASNLQRAQALRQATLAKAFAPSDLIQYARQ
ncbi:MAG: type I restriction endonuclease [Acidovorax sp.]|nr:type I restriction endonuclease [Acidovorax sp.]